MWCSNVFIIIIAVQMMSSDACRQHVLVLLD